MNLRCLYRVIIAHESKEFFVACDVEEEGTHGERIKNHESRIKKKSTFLTFSSSSEPQ